MSMWDIIYTFTTWVANIHERLLRINEILAKRDHTMVITWLYVFTVIIVLAFAIEIGQWYTGTGVMESQDIAYGITGFLVMFLLFAILRGLYHGIKAMVEKDDRKTKVYSREDLERYDK